MDRSIKSLALLTGNLLEANFCPLALGVLEVVGGAIEILKPARILKNRKSGYPTDCTLGFLGSIRGYKNIIFSVLPARLRQMVLPISFINSAQVSLTQY